jgi:4-amino-4-deoxy-L-arabinose transferase-like glycosyltransferase
MQADADRSTDFAPPLWRSFWAIAAAITTARVLTLMLTPLGIGPDEAQYWCWSRDFAFGYFSKPPLIAWAIAATTSVFGDADWAVRLPAPFFHLGAAAFLYLTAKRLYGARAAFWTGLGWLTMPGVVLSSFIIATDAPLLLFWSGALFFLVRIIEDKRAPAGDFILLGVMIGFGMMSKYAMMYFPAALAITLLIRPIREKLLRTPLLLTALAALAIFAPNILWNMENDFQTLSHTAANANWGAPLFRPLNLIEFLGGQFAVFGLILFSALIYCILSWRRLRADPMALLLLVFALTPLVIVAGQAFLSRAHANWAAAAYPAALLLVTGLLLREGRGRLLKASLALHGAVFAIFSIGVLNLYLVDGAGLSRAVKDLRGWKAQTDAIIAYAPGYDAVLVDNRYLMGEMLYHQRASGARIAALNPNDSIDNHYEAFIPFDPERMKRVLFVTTREDAAHAAYRFGSIERLGAVDADIGGVKRRYTLFALGDYYGSGAD